MKKLLVFIIVLGMLFAFTGCNKQIFDTTYTFHTAIVKLADDSVVKGEVKSWRDFKDGDQIQVTMADGATYLVHSTNCTLIGE